MQGDRPRVNIHKGCKYFTAGIARCSVSCGFPDLTLLTQAGIQVPYHLRCLLGTSLASPVLTHQMSCFVCFFINSAQFTVRCGWRRSPGTPDPHTQDTLQQEVPSGWGRGRAGRYKDTWVLYPSSSVSTVHGRFPQASAEQRTPALLSVLFMVDSSKLLLNSTD